MTLAESDPRPRGPHDVEPHLEREDVGLGSHVDPNIRRLREALAGMELGTYDEQILRWLAGRESSTVEVIATWVERAAELLQERS